MRKACLNLCIAVAVLGLAACSKPSEPPMGKTAELTPAAKAAGAADVVLANPLGRKPGLWEMTNTVDGTQVAAMKTVMCIDAALGEKMSKMAGNRKSDIDCGQRNIMAMPNGAIIDQTCTMDKTTVTSHIEITSVSDSEFHQTIDSKFSPAVGGREQSKVSMDGKWLGACPSTMKPGDMQLPGGIVVNMPAMADKMKK